MNVFNVLLIDKGSKQATLCIHHHLMQNGTKAVDLPLSLVKTL